MDVINMQYSKILKSVTDTFPTLQFVSSDQFHWSPDTMAVSYDPNDPRFIERLLHEISHAELSHSSYQRDIELIEMERDAWEHAKVVLGPQFHYEVKSDVIQDDLDTYRDWLHARSTCPSCSGNGLQRADLVYECPSCRSTWTANTAKICALRRYTKSRS